jgi:hypothetical protein
VRPINEKMFRMKDIQDGETPFDCLEKIFVWDYFLNFLPYCLLIISYEYKSNFLIYFNRFKKCFQFFIFIKFKNIILFLKLNSQVNPHYNVKKLNKKLQGVHFEFGADPNQNQASFILPTKTKNGVKYLSSSNNFR